MKSEILTMKLIFFKKYKFTILVSIIILILSLINTSKIEIDEKYLIHNFDKIIHFIMYMSLTYIFKTENFINNNFGSNTKQNWLIIISTITLGITVEILQSTITNYRSGDFIDEIANLTGVITALILFSISKNLIKSLTKKLKFDKV